MTKKKFRRKGKIGKIFTESEKFLGNKGENLKQGEMHHCLRGMDATERTKGKTRS